MTRHNGTRNKNDWDLVSTLSPSFIDKYNVIDFHFVISHVTTNSIHTDISIDDEVIDKFDSDVLG